VILNWFHRTTDFAVKRQLTRLLVVYVIKKFVGNVDKIFMVLVSALVRLRLKCGRKVRLGVKLELVQDVAQLLKKMGDVLICCVILVIIDFVGLVDLLRQDGFINYK
jgi:hypothetical protein